MTKYIVDIKGEIEGDYEIIGKYEDPQQGEWIEEVVPVGLVGRGNRQCRCSLCGHGDIQAKTQEVPYCWFCGAKMREADNGS